MNWIDFGIRILAALFLGGVAATWPLATSVCGHS